ncbi:MAG: Hsp20/alpha crystallin family protein [bacterium JZ-2024 1]
MLLTRRRDFQDPFAEVRALVRSLDRMWDELRPFSWELEPMPFSRWVPPVDILEKPDAHIIRLDLPGLSPEQVKVEIRDNTLTVSGTREEARKEEGANYCRQERYFGAFQRSFELPANIQTDAVSADFSNGVLEIRLPKTEEAKPKEVKVRVTSSK